MENVSEGEETVAVGAAAVTWTVLGVLELKPLLTTSCTTYMPATPATKFGVAVAALFSVGADPGAEIKDHA